ncbi:MAG: metallopeptidase family protein [Clostridia bacterium]|nr:metallopeptidase family protein [Clostridia bacterium]
MISAEVYKQIVFELMDELPDAFYKELSGGVIVSDAVKAPDYARANDLYTMGEYRVYSGVRQVVLYRGSFDRVYPYADEAQAKDLLRGILRHEIRHHLEALGGIHDDTSLEAADERQKQAYLSRHPDDRSSR